MYQAQPSLDELDRFSVVKHKFEFLLSNCNCNVERKNLEGPNKSTLYRLLNAALKRSEPIPTLMDEADFTAIDDQEEPSC